MRKTLESQHAQPEAPRYGTGRIVIGSLVFTSANIALASRASGEARADAVRLAVDTSFRLAGGQALAQPTLITTLGQPSGIRVDTELGPVELSLRVTELP